MKISYEASKWYIKVWRQRWYIYAIFLYILNLLKLNIIIDFIIDIVIDENDEFSQEKKIRQDWKYIKRHVELTKMYKYTIKRKFYERED